MPGHSIYNINQIQMRSRRTSSDCVGEDKLLIHEVYRRVADKVKDAPPGHLSGLLAGINNGSGNTVWT